MFIRTIDTDFVVFAVFAINHLPARCELWLAFRTGMSFRNLASHQLSANLGPVMSSVLLMFHALIGCDTVCNDAMSIIERFFILLFDRISTCNKVNRARMKLFLRKQYRCSKSGLPELL